MGDSSRSGQRQTDDQVLWLRARTGFVSRLAGADGLDAAEGWAAQQAVHPSRSRNRLGGLLDRRTQVGAYLSPEAMGIGLRAAGHIRAWVTARRCPRVGIWLRRGAIGELP